MQKKQWEGFESTAIGRGSGLATRLLLQLQAAYHQTLIHLRNSEVFVSSMMTLNILIMSYMKVLKKSDSGNWTGKHTKKEVIGVLLMKHADQPLLI